MVQIVSNGVEVASVEGCITLQRIRSAARRLIFAIPQLDMEVRIAVINAVTEFVADSSE